MLDVRRLQIFAAVAQYGSFTAAGEALFMSHSAVSQQMARLEREVGMPLVRRRPRGVELTGSGTLLAERCTVLFGILSSIERELLDLAQTPPRVRLGTFPTAGADLIPRVLREYRRRFPATVVELYPVSGDAMADRIRDGSVHIGLVWDYDIAPRGFGPDCEWIHLLDDPLYVLLPREHPLAGRQSIALARLAGENWVVRVHRPPYEHAFTTMCRIAGFEPKVGFTTEDYQAVQGLVAAGIGVSLLPRLSLAAHRDDVVALPLRGPAAFHRRIAALRLMNAPHPSAAARMLAVLRDTAGTIGEGSLPA